MRLAAKVRELIDYMRSTTLLPGSGYRLTRTSAGTSLSVASGARAAAGPKPRDAFAISFRVDGDGVADGIEVSEGVVWATGQKVGLEPLTVTAAAVDTTETKYVYLKYTHSTLGYVSLGGLGPGAEIIFEDDALTQEEMDDDDAHSFGLLGWAVFEAGEPKTVIQLVDSAVPFADADRGHCEVWAGPGEADVPPAHFEIVYPTGEDVDGPFLRMCADPYEVNEVTGSAVWRHGGNQEDTHGEVSMKPGAEGDPLALSGGQIVELHHAKYPQGYRVLLIRRK